MSSSLRTRYGDFSYVLIVKFFRPSGAYFIDAPRSFVNRAAEERGIPRGRMSVCKTRAIETLSRLTEKSVDDYNESVFFKLHYSGSETEFM